MARFTPIYRCQRCGATLRGESYEFDEEGSPLERLARNGDSVLIQRAPTQQEELTSNRYGYGSPRMPIPFLPNYNKSHSDPVPITHPDKTLHRCGIGGLGVSTLIGIDTDEAAEKELDRLMDWDENGAPPSPYAAHPHDMKRLPAWKDTILEALGNVGEK